MEQKKNKNLRYGIIIFIILLLVDQISKQIMISYYEHINIISGILEIQVEHNTGGAFGVGQQSTVMFIIANIVVLGLIIRFIYLQKNFMDRKTLYTLFVILAGGFGNLIDRLIRGYVVDFIKIFPKTNFPIFNFADMYITLGWILLALIFAIYTYKEIKVVKK